jgi:RHS repeat-associated protein
VGANALEWELGLDAPKDFTLPDRTEGLRFVSPAVRQAVVTASVPGVGRFEPVRDAYGTLVREQRADGANRRFAYDANGNVRTFVDADGRVFRSEYSSWNHRVREISPLGHVEQHAYDAHESRTALVDPGGTRSEYVYDEKDRLVEVHRHGQLRERYLYDDADRLVEKQDRDRATLVKWTFGTGPLKATRELASGEKQSFAYDEHGRLIAGAGAAGELNFAYQASGRRVRDLRDGKGVEHHGPLLDVHVLGRFVTRTRKVDATTTVLVDPTGNIHRLMTDAHGLQHRELAHGVTETTQYHPDGMPLMRALERPHSDTPLWVRRYHYDAEGNLTRAVDTERGLREFGYDAAGRLEREVSPDGSVAPYAYDEAGNLLQMPGLSEHGRQGSAAASPGHECIARGAGNRIYRANGQLFQYDLRDHVAVRVAADGSPVRYTYDSFDHLVGIEAPGLSFSAKYDVLGRRTERTVNGERCLYYWDTDRLAAECFPDGRLRVYVYAGDRSLVPLMFVDYGSEDAPTDSGQVYYVFANHLGCPELITDAHGAAVWRAHIAPYGNATLELGHDFHQPLRWPGHFYDAETGLHYNRFRYYDPSLGRYLQSDPAGIAGGSNLYAYTDNPLRQVDVRGLGCPNKKRKVDEGEGEPEQESADAAIRRRHGEEWGVDAETGKLDPNARFQGKTHAEVDALARKPARDGEPDIVRRRRRYLEEKRKENKEPRPMNQWAEDGYRVNANRDRSSPHEEGALSAVGAKPNNAAAGEGGQNTHEHTEWHDKNGRALPPNPDGTPPKGATGQRTTTTRPDGTRGNDVVEHKHLTGEDGTLHDSQQLRAQREMARQRGGEHELVMSSDKPPLANGDPPVQPSSGAADGSNVKYYDTTRDPPQVTHQWDKGRWKPV